MGLLQDVKDEAHRKGYSPATGAAYARWVHRFVLFQERRHPAEMGTDEVRSFLVALATERDAASSTRNQALAALRFLYRHVLRDVPEGLDDLTRSKSDTLLPVVLTRQEVIDVLAKVPKRRRLPLQLLYGSGMRLGECLGLRLKDLDLARGQIHVRKTKGRRDRITLLPRTLHKQVEAQIRVVEEQHQQDLAKGAGYVEIPGALARSAPHLAQSIGWQWLFPATKHYQDDESGEWRRHHLHPTVLQRTMRRAVARAGLLKRATCHTFRHSFATHMLEKGVSVRKIQMLLGHADLRTTMLYTHVTQDRFDMLVSPMDDLGGGEDGGV